jgi:hypothetical protein
VNDPIATTVTRTIGAQPHAISLVIALLLAEAKQPRPEPRSPAVPYQSDLLPASVITLLRRPVELREIVNLVLSSSKVWVPEADGQ